MACGCDRECYASDHRANAMDVPGVPGIGQKTALSLIKKFGSMDRLYEQVEEITKKKQKENLKTYKEQALLSRKLVTIDTQAPISFSPRDFAAVAPDREKLLTLFKELEFNQLQQAFSEKAQTAQKEYRLILNRTELEQLVKSLVKAGRFAVDTETTSVNPMEAELVGL